MANKILQGLTKYLLLPALTTGFLAPPISSQEPAVQESKPPVYIHTDVTNYPKSFTLLYKISEGFEVGGNALRGGGRLFRDSNLVSLSVKFDHPKEKRLMVFEEKNIGERKIEYSEYEHNFLEKKDTYNWCDTFFIGEEDRMQTIPSLVAGLIDGNLEEFQEEIFSFKGTRSHLANYKLNRKKQWFEKNNLYIEAEIKENNPKVSKVRGGFTFLNDKNIPVDLGIDYRVKWSPIPLPFGWDYKTFTLPGEITDSLDVNLFEKPKK